ncbi:MAG: chromosome segregation protein SMC, partial [Opitutales bacterium]
MYLKEIAINGFKSFAERTRLDLQHGVTAIVGPNGCGKSNIVDAVRWVLGEQSAKALRGASMQDVIFEGTDKRKPLPVCEVALTFSGCEAELGTAFNEVAISRRVTRDGGSDYYINGKVSRLKDIQRLFANTGVGRVSYSFMLQGQIDQVLSTNPAERRIIFEEAAGITLYKAQRKEALNKLTQVDANLARVTDVIEEVSRQIGSLKRQASKALRYQRMQHRLTHLDLAFSAHRHTGLTASIDKLVAESEGYREKVNTRSASLEGDEKKLADKKEERKQLSEKIQELQQRVYNLRSEKENAENQSEFSEIRSKDLQTRIDACKKEISDLETEQKQLAERARNESENKQLQLNIVDDSDRIFRERNDEVVKAQEALAEKEGQLQERRQAVLHAENRINRARSRCTTLEVELKSYQVKHASLKETRDTLNQSSETLEQELADARKLLAHRREEHETAEAELQKEREHSNSLLQEFRALQERIQEQDRNLARKSAHLNVLENLQAKFEGFGEGAKAILGDELGDLVAKEDVAILSRELDIPSSYTAALEVILGPAAEALYVGDPEKAVGISGQLQSRKLGRACLQVGLGVATEAEQGEPPEWMVPAASVLKVQNENLLAPVERLLGGCYIVEDLGAFMRFWENRPDFRFRLVATREGEAVDSRGLLFGGSTSGEQADSVLERETEIRSLRHAAGEQRKDLDKLRREAQELEEKRNVAESSVENRRKRLSELASEISALVEQERGQQQKIEENKRNLRKAEEELEQLDEKHGHAVSELEEARRELKNAEQALEQERSKESGLEEEIARARELRDEKREALADVRLELAEKKQRLESVDRALGEVERETGNIKERIRSRNQEIDTLNEQIKELRQSGEEQSKKSKELEKTLQVAAGELEKDGARLKEMDKEIMELDNGLTERRKENHTFERNLNKLEVRLAEERSQLNFIEENARGEYQVDLGEVDWKSELWTANIAFEKRVNFDDLDDPDKITAQPKEDPREPTEEELAEMDDMDWSAVEQEISELKGRISNMGPVNLDAISEYADLKERHDFLKKQSEDLWNSKNALVQTIDEINETSQTLFRDTFEQVRKNFAYTYEKMSGGGESDLKLVDADDPLESGVEITARPPGTRLKSVTLLSGGQRTMAAVALLFAIYLVKPSPICVLDEIDAALDDANIGRFCEMLRGFTEKSQFLIVTHNKRTISNADTVFGVTMPEGGVSTLVSMRFDKDGGNPALAGAAG